MTTHDILLIHASATLLLAGVMWAIQLGLVPLLAHATEETWPRHTQVYRRVFRTLFWPLLVVEAGSGFLAALQQPAGIPPWVHGINLTLLAAAWGTIPLVRLAVGHHPLARFDPDGFRRFARLNWIRVIVWTARGAVVMAMLRLAAGARAG